MTSACNRVLSTTELLESILTQISPINYLLQAHLISRFFHTTIQTSPRLQQILFIRPETDRDITDSVVNPLLQQHFAPWFPPYKGRADYDALKRMEWASSPSTREAFLRPGASWRHMLPVQPAPRRLDVQWLEHCQAGPARQIAKVEGVTMGRVYDVTESFLRAEYAGYAQFRVEFCGGEAVLYLESTMQCDMGEGRGLKGWDLRSRGVELTHELEWDEGHEVEGGGYGFGGMESNFD